jgi:hypothetical protein
MEYLIKQPFCKYFYGKHILDRDYPDEIEKENAIHWAGTDCQDEFFGQP